MAFSDVWIEGYPVGTTPANELDTAISQGTKRALRERLAVDHIFESTETDSNIGAHKKLTIPVLAADPTSIEDGIIIYAKTVDSVGELFSITEEDVVTQLTKGGKLNGASLVNMLTGVPTWDATVTYAQYVIIRLNGTLYVSLQGTNLNKNPSTETTYWKALFGTKAGQALLLSEDDKLPAVDGSALTGLPIVTPYFGVGTIADGETIPLPEGYTAEQVTCFVSPNYYYHQDTIGGSGEEGNKSHYCSVDANRLVLVYTIVNESFGRHGGTANYLIIGVK